MLKNILAVLGGVLAGFVGVMVFEMAGHLLFPVPGYAELDITDPEALRAFAATIPLVNQIALMVGWAGAAIAAGFVARKIKGDLSLILNLIAGGIFILPSVYNLYMIPSPIWMWVIGIAVWLPGAWLGRKLASK